MSSKSTMVWAKKYRLTEPLSINAGTFKKNGAKEFRSEGLVPRQYVEDRNSHENNELYIIDEEKTAELMEQREQNIIENNERAKRDSLTTADLIDSIVGKKEPAKKPAKPSESASSEPANSPSNEGNKPSDEPTEPANDLDFESMTVEELQQYCLNHGFKYHHKAGKEKLIEIINKNQ